LHQFFADSCHSAEVGALIIRRDKWHVGAVSQPYFGTEAANLSLASLERGLVMLSRETNGAVCTSLLLDSVALALRPVGLWKRQKCCFIQS